MFLYVGILLCVFNAAALGTRGVYCRYSDATSVYFRDVSRLYIYTQGCYKLGENHANKKYNPLRDMYRTLHYNKFELSREFQATAKILRLLLASMELEPSQTPEMLGPRCFRRRSSRSGDHLELRFCYESISFNYCNCFNHHLFYSVRVQTQIRRGGLWKLRCWLWFRFSWKPLIAFFFLSLEFDMFMIMFMFSFQ